MVVASEHRQTSPTCLLLCLIDYHGAVVGVQQLLDLHGGKLGLPQALVNNLLADLLLRHIFCAASPLLPKFQLT